MFVWRDGRVMEVCAWRSITVSWRVVADAMKMQIAHPLHQDRMNVAAKKATWEMVSSVESSTPVCQTTEAAILWPSVN